MFFRATVREAESGNVISEMPLSALSLKIKEDTDSATGFLQTIEATVPAGLKYLPLIEHGQRLDIVVTDSVTGAIEGYYFAYINRIKTDETVRKSTLKISASTTANPMSESRVIQSKGLISKSVDNGAISISCAPSFYAATGYTYELDGIGYRIVALELIANSASAVMKLKLELR